MPEKSTKRTRPEKSHIKVAISYRKNGLNVVEEHFYDGWCADSAYKALRDLWPILDSHVPAEQALDLHPVDTTTT